MGKINDLAIDTINLENEQEFLLDRAWNELEFGGDLTQEDIDEVTLDKRIEEAEQAGRDDEMAKDEFYDR